MTETRKLAAILVSDIVGYSRLAGADEDRILARLRTLRSDLIDPTIAVHRGRIVKRTGDGSIIEFRSVVDAVNCAIEVQRAMVERNAEVTPDKRIEFRITRQKTSHEACGESGIARVSTPAYCAPSGDRLASGLPAWATNQGSKVLALTVEKELLRAPPIDRGSQLSAFGDYSTIRRCGRATSDRLAAS